MIGYIYALSLDGVSFRYVGMSCRPAERLTKHRHGATHGSMNAVHCWMRKHGPENIVQTILCAADLDDLPSAERWWIAEMRELGYDLHNHTDGGEGAYGRTASPETRKKIADAAQSREYVMTPERLKKLQIQASTLHLGRVHTPEARARMKAGAQARAARDRENGRSSAHTPEMARTVAEKNRGKTRTPEQRARISAAMKASAERRRSQG